MSFEKKTNINKTATQKVSLTKINANNMEEYLKTNYDESNNAVEAEKNFSKEDSTTDNCPDGKCNNPNR